MTNALPWDAVAADVLREELVKLQQVELASQHPAYLLHFTKCVDSRSGEVFDFELFTDEDEEWLSSVGIEPRGLGRHWTRFTQDTEWLESIGVDSEGWFDGPGWGWQRSYLDWILENDQTICLKGRQLGVTWVASGLALWYLLFKPGTDTLIYSIGEDEAQEVIGRIWDMFLSLPEHLRNGVKVLKPQRGRPSERIEVEHTIVEPDGSTRVAVSSIDAMASTKKAGHSRSAALVIFDEASRNDYARDLWKAVVPATADHGGKIVVISTANGMSDPSTKLGNFFHELWTGAGGEDYPGLKQRFLHWSLHPGRDEGWKERLSMDADAKAEQYPETPEEAFLMSGSPFFDVSALKWYALNAKAVPLFQGEFVIDDPAKPNVARFDKRDGGAIHVFRPPRPDGKYAMAVDNATGHGTDYSVAAIVDLSDGFPCAEMHTKGDADRVAEQVHFLGLWFNKARIAPEKQGGYGDTVIAYLRDGKNGRKSYPKLYRYRRVDRPGTPEASIYGFPMNAQTRPLVINELKKWIRERLLPVMTPGLLSECRLFVHRDTRPSPRAADGANDDRVLAWCIAYELYREFGEHEHDVRKTRRAKQRSKKKKPLYPFGRRPTTT